MKNTLHLNGEHARARLLRFVQNVPLDRDLEFRWKKHQRDRSLEQNAMSHAIYAEVAEQLGDRTIAEVRAESKLHIGVPILRASDPEYCEMYDKAIKPLPYEDKLKAVLYWPVTSLMTVPQMQQYLDQMQMHWVDKGIFFGSEAA